MEMTVFNKLQAGIQSVDCRKGSSSRRQWLSGEEMRRRIPEKGKAVKKQVWNELSEEAVSEKGVGEKEKIE